MVMVFSLCPAVAQAADEPIVFNVGTEQELRDTLEKKIDDSKYGGTPQNYIVNLTADIRTTSHEYYAQNLSCWNTKGTVTLLGHGHTIYMVDPNFTAEEYAAGQSGGTTLSLSNGCTFNLGDPNKPEESKLTITGTGDPNNPGYSGNPLIHLSGKATLNMYDGVKITNYKPAFGAAEASVAGVGIVLTAWGGMNDPEQDPEGLAFNMYGGEISHLEAPAVLEPDREKRGAYDLYTYGTAVTLIGKGVTSQRSYTRPTFNMHGGTITENKSNVGYAAGVWSYDGQINIYDGEISNNVATNKMVDKKGAKKTWVAGGGVYLGGSAVTNYYNLNGVKNKSFNMSGGSIVGNRIELDSGAGAGVFIDGSGQGLNATAPTETYSNVFNMTGGKISNNSGGSWGGGVVVTGMSYVHLEGGEISGNETKGYGGGLYLNNFLDENTLGRTLDGVTITGNTAGKAGGGIYYRETKLPLSGATVVDGNKLPTNESNNIFLYRVKAEADPGAEDILWNAPKESDGDTGVDVGGGDWNDTDIEGGLRSMKAAASAYTGDVLPLEMGVLTAGAKIGVGVTAPDYAETDIPFGAFTEEYTENNPDTDPSTYFFSDNPNYGVVYTDDQKEARLGHRVTFDPNGGTMTPPTGGVAGPDGTYSVGVGEGQTVAKPANDPTLDGHTFKGWTLDDAAYDFTSPVTKGITLTAQWEKKTSSGGGNHVKYHINTVSTGEGTISSDRASATSGTTVTITVKGDLKNITAVDANGKNVTLTAKGDSAYTFKMPAAAVTVTAEFEAGIPDLIDPDESGVSDWLNTEDHMAYMVGYDTGLFGAEDTVTRGQVAVMFYRLLKDKNISASAIFEDVPADAWYAEGVNALATLGIIKGVGGGLYQPDRAITRAEFATIATRFTKMSVEPDFSFRDVPETHWAYKEIHIAAAYGWVNGIGNNEFAPDALISRAEAAAIINRMMARIPDRSAIDGGMGTRFPDVSELHWAFYEIVEASTQHDYARPSNTAEETWKQ